MSSMNILMCHYKLDMYTNGPNCFPARSVIFYPVRSVIFYPAHSVIFL